MQQDKSTKKREKQAQIEERKQEELTQTISQVAEQFKINSFLGRFDVLKRSGMAISTLGFILLSLPFLGLSSVKALSASTQGIPNKAGKDAYYGVKNNPLINWMNLIVWLSKHFVSLLVSAKYYELQEKRVKALIFDDTALEKTGSNIEGVSYIHNHVGNIFILGYKLLVSGFWDGYSFIPLDFSLHKESRTDDKFKKTVNQLVKKQNKQQSVLEYRQGILQKLEKQREALSKAQYMYTQKQNKTRQSVVLRLTQSVARLEKQILAQDKVLENIQKAIYNIENQIAELSKQEKKGAKKRKNISLQYSKRRKKGTPGHTRINELKNSKIDSLIKMLGRAIKNGFVPDYVLVDTWFFCQKVVQSVIDIGRGVHLVAMAKIGNAKYELLPNSRYLTPMEIITLYNRDKGKNSRKYKARYIKLQANYQGCRVQIFLIKFGQTDKWRMLVTTDLTMSFTKIIEVYKIRWTIEVFFKECKQNLLLGKSQSQDFDAQIADTALSMIRYLLLSFYQRTHYGYTLGGLFRGISQNTSNQNILAHINHVLMELIELFAQIMNIDIIELYTQTLRNPKSNDLLQRLGCLGNFEKRVAGGV